MASCATPHKADHPAVAANSFESQIDDLVSQMTLAEKLGQLSQKGFPEPFDDKAKQEIRDGRWGSLYNGGTAAEKAEAQRIAVQESRLHVPIVFAHDVIHGYRTTFPIPLGESATWNPQLLQQAARLTAIEASREGIHWTFAPMMDVGRDARWGRIAETLGEDPYLAGEIAAAEVRGFQGDSLAAADSIAACGKHYVGYGAAEAGRDYNVTWIPNQLLRNVYLRPFHAAEQAGAASFMSAFNDINGVPATGNAFTLRQVLRKEWGFDGLVVSDYQAVTELIPSGYASDDADAAAKSIQAGVDMEMVSTSYYDHCQQLIDSGQLDPNLIDAAVRNVLRLKFRLGLFGDKGKAIPADVTPPDAKTLTLAKQVAEQSLVLLKNDDNVLPLSHSVGKVAVIGPLADSPVDQLGSWVVGGGEQYVQTPLAAMRQTLGESRVIWAQGLKTSRDESHDGFDAAVDAAKSADVVVLFLGEEAAMSGEAASRAFLNLPGAQEELVSAIAATGKPVIAVIMSGRPLTFEKTATKLNAILWSFDPGTMGGPAIVDTLFGDSVPSGKLTVTFPRTVGECPIYYNHVNTGRPAWTASDGPASKDKYTSKYIDVSFTPEYPFGYGLSYSHFQYSNLQLSSNLLTAGGELQVSANVTNDGKYKGDEIVQLYTRQMWGTLTRPVRELKSFRRITLNPGQMQTVQFTLNPADLAYFAADGTVINDAAEFHVWIGPDSASGLMGKFNYVK